MTTFAFVTLSLILGYRLFFPSPLVIETSKGDASIYFSANRALVLSSHNCALVRWRVEKINQVYINDQPQVGSGIRRTCAIDSSPSLRVIFQDGTEQTYRLNVTPVSAEPSAYIVLVLAFITAYLRRNELVLLIHQPLRFTAALLTLTVLLFLFFGYFLSLSETIATGNLLDASNAIASLLVGLTVLAFLLLLAAPLSRNFLLSPDSPDTQTTSYTCMGFTWIIGLSAAIILIGSVILVVNPRGMYFARNYSPYELLLRGTKTDGYAHLPQPPDLVIMGSSRAFTLSPNYIQSATGLTAYNMAIEGGRVEDFLIQARQMPVLPKLLWIEVQQGLPRQPNNIAARAPLNWLPYMSFDTALLTVEKRLTGLIDLHQFAESIYTAHYYPIYSREPQEWPSFDANGFVSRPLLSPSELEQAVLLDIGRISPPRCERVDPQSTVDINALINIVETQHASLVFYLSPWHPRYYDAILQNDPQYLTCYGTTLDYFQNLTETYSSVFFLDFTRLSAIGGIDTEAGYYDSQHITEANGSHLIDHAAETLLQAYRAAEEAQ